MSSVDFTPQALAAIQRELARDWDGREQGGALVGRIIGETVVIEDAGGLGIGVTTARGNSWFRPPLARFHDFARACRCALEMVKGLDKLNREWESEGRRPIAIGIGLNTGPVNVGNMGSDKRLAWTVMGDNVNLASRLEGMTKAFGVGIIVTQEVAERIARADPDGHQLRTRKLGMVRAKGFTEPVAA